MLAGLLLLRRALLDLCIYEDDEDYGDNQCGMRTHARLRNEDAEQSLCRGDRLLSVDRYITPLGQQWQRGTPSTGWDEATPVPPRRLADRPGASNCAAAPATGWMEEEQIALPVTDGLGTGVRLAL